MLIINWTLKKVYWRPRWQWYTDPPEIWYLEIKILWFQITLYSMLAATYLIDEINEGSRNWNKEQEALTTQKAAQSDDSTDVQVTAG